MKGKLVSVIIPTYNRADTLKFAIKSVLNQSYRNLELIIVDDGSTDNTKEIIDSFSNHTIKYIKQDHSGLPAVVRNNGLKNAKGEYIAFLDSDDIWISQKLEKQMKLFNKKQKILLLATNAKIFNYKFQYEGITNLERDKFISYEELMEYNNIVNSTVLFKRDILEKIGYLDINPLAVGIEDFDYWLRILKFQDKSIFLTGEIMCYYRKDESSLLRSISPLKSYLRHKYISSKHEKYKKNALRERAIINLKKKILIDLEKKNTSIFRVLKKKYISFNEKILLIHSHVNRIKIKYKSVSFSKNLISIIQIVLIIINKILIITEKILSIEI